MSKQKRFDKVNLLGVDVDAVSITDAIDYIIELAATDQPAAYVVKPYVVFLDRAYKSDRIKQLLNNADLAVPDGVALMWGAAYLYAGKRSFLRYWKTLAQIVSAPNELRWPLPDRAAGINFSLPLMQAASDHRLKVFLIGNPTNGRGIESTAAYLKDKFPDLDVSGTLSGRDQSRPPGRVSEQWLAHAAVAITDAKPDIILVGMGFPLQEEVAATLVDRTSHGVYVGEGGTFDYEAFGGSLPKAPAQVQKLGLEWLWRLIREPKRIGRMLSIPKFMFRIWTHRT